MSKLQLRKQLREKLAGGIDPQDDIHDIVGKMVGVVDTFDSSDIAHATYVFDYIQAFDSDIRIRNFWSALAKEYAERFAEWLEFVFLDRANRTRNSKQMKDMMAGLEEWVESIPDILLKKAKPQITPHVPKNSRFLNFDTLEKIGSKIVRTVYADWGAVTSGRMASARTAAGLSDLSIEYNRASRKYEIEGDRTTFRYKRTLYDLGFRWDKWKRVWVTDQIDSDIIRAIPGAKKLRAIRPPKPAPKSAPTPSRPEPTVEDPALTVEDWFFDTWLPSNIDRFSDVFNGYGRTEGVPYFFKFKLTGHDVEIEFKRNIKSVEAAKAELRSRYSKQKDREGWFEALTTHDLLKGASGGKAAMHAIDMANNLEHTHGAMMEHFPKGVADWYPAFLDFKYTAHPRKMIQRMRSGDLRVICRELLPLKDRQERLVTPETQHRTPKGLALEITGQKGKKLQREKAEEIKKIYPDMWDDVVAHMGTMPMPKGKKRIVGSPRVARIANKWLRRSTRKR